MSWYLNLFTTARCLSWRLTFKYPTTDSLLSDYLLLQDCALIARKIGLDATSLTTTAPDSSQLTDRIEALHNQAIQIRNLALSFYEASHPPKREVTSLGLGDYIGCLPGNIILRVMLFNNSNFRSTKDAKNSPFSHVFFTISKTRKLK